LPDELDLLEEFGKDPANWMKDLSRISTSEELMGSHQWERAAARLRPLLEKHPKSGHVAGLMATALVGKKNLGEAIPLFKKASELEPHVDSHVRKLVAILSEAKRDAEAEQALAAFVKENPCGGLRDLLGGLLHRQQRFSEQLRVLAEGAAACPESGRDLNAYAWALATCSVDELRDGGLAVDVAQRAIANTDGEVTPPYLSTLAAAFAEAGDYEAAVQAGQRAVEALKRDGARRSQVFAYSRRLAKLEAKFPIRD
jgi:tetratricopeptide (TPR) repeat protein